MPLFSKHIAIELLADRAEGKRLSAEQLNEISSHLSICNQCDARAKAFETFFAHAGDRRLETPPAAATANALRIFTTADIPARPSMVNRLLGVLAFDDWDPAFAVNERYAFSDSRQLLYRSADHDVDLRIAPMGDTWAVAGQILGNCTGGQVLLAAAGYSAETPLNESCEFNFADVPAGSYSLRVIFDGNVFEIESVEVK